MEGGGYVIQISENVDNAMSVLCVLEGMRWEGRKNWLLLV